MIYSKKKKRKCAIKEMTKTSMVAAGSAIALGGVGGASALHGQQGIARATSFMPAMGSMVGAGMLMGAVQELGYKKKRKKKR